MNSAVRPSVGATRTVTAWLEADVPRTADLVLAVAVADGHPGVDEAFVLRLDGVVVPTVVLAAPHRGRLHLARDVGPGKVIVDYRATVDEPAAPDDVDSLDRIRYLRPSRYCESDRLFTLARAEFAGLGGLDLLAAVSNWVGTHISYVPGSSRPTDGAAATLLGREGVCRDFAHLTAAFLRANDVPARVVAVYAPGLDPMDFHAVTEALVDGSWVTVDPTCLAPRQSMVRIATGADAAEVAFLTNIGGPVELTAMAVTAVVDPQLPFDDITRAVQLR